MLEVTMEELRKVCRDFYNITDIQIVLYDENRNHLFSYPEGHRKFCEKIRSDKELEEKCIMCDNAGFDICEKTRKPYIYTCHMKLSEAIAPIIENNMIIGYMMIGQILTRDSFGELMNQTKKISQKYGLDFELLKSYAEELKIADNDFIYSSINMASMCACYLYCNKIIKDRSDIIIHQLLNYIDLHLAEDLSTKKLCREMCMSRSKLYSLSVSALGMGVSKYITKKRIDEAKKMLSETNKPIYEISDAVGYGDANYFVRIFKASQGVTPGEYRRGFRKESRPKSEK